ncbi:MAG TPA: CRISPR-associated protein Cas4 [Petrimonas sp.]|nr:CRISPR-associated protein Cas4 [Petrimonas sp.]
MRVTGTHFNYFMICHRKLWLFANGIQMEHVSELVEMGKLIHETSYPGRSSKFEEVEIGGIKIDYYDAKSWVIHEIKKSDKIEKAHEMQLKYYIWVLEQYGIGGVSGVLEYPRLRKTEQVYLSNPDREEIPAMISDIEAIVLSDQCPEKVEMKMCKNCSYYDFCWSTEADL